MDGDGWGEVEPAVKGEAVLLALTGGSCPFRREPESMVEARLSGGSAGYALDNVAAGLERECASARALLEGREALDFER